MSYRKPYPEEITLAYNEGAEAYSSLLDNPYNECDHPELYHAWEKGFNEERECHINNELS